MRAAVSVPASVGAQQAAVSYSAASSLLIFRRIDDLSISAVRQWRVGGAARSGCGAIWSGVVSGNLNFLNRVSGQLLAGAGVWSCGRGCGQLDCNPVRETAYCTGAVCRAGLVAAGGEVWLPLPEPDPQLPPKPAPANSVTCPHR